MSEPFGDVNAEPRPGTALRTMVEEHRYLDEFVAMIKAKLELDEKHVSELRALRNSWNSNWVGSGIGPLVSPLLAHLDNEITEWENAMAELAARFAALPEAPPPTALDEDGSDPLEVIDGLENRYYEYDTAHKAVVTPESINELKKWRNQAGERDWALPVSERTYRKAVVAQQETVERAIKWAADELTGVLERHQHRTEDVKSFLNLLLTSYGSIHMGLSTSCSAAVEGNRAFSSSRFIAPRHDEREKETSHVLLQMVQYRNYMLSGQVARPIFGLGTERTVWLFDQLFTDDPYYAVSFFFREPDWTTRVFKLEEEAVTKELPALFSSQTTRGRYEILTCALFMDTPLLPLVEYDVTRYRNSVSRKVLSALLDLHLPLRRTEVLKLLLRLVDSGKEFYGEADTYYRVGILISHDAGDHAERLVESIWRKWDIENDRPFPEGVERVWDGLHAKSEVVWQKNGKPYYFPKPDSSI